MTKPESPVPPAPRWLSGTVPLLLWSAGLSVFVLAGLVGGYFVFTQGLAITNLTDLVPWGLWIVIDLSSIALSAGAFSLCALVHLVGLKRYEPVARTATFVGAIGYSMAMLCLLLDIGRPDRFWHGFVFWNPHSVLWEVTMCVGLYFSVLSIEVLPIIGHADWMQRYLPWAARPLSGLHRFAPALAVAGLGLSMLHQSSLGATFGVLIARPAWYRPGLSVLFIYSAVIGGISLTLLASTVSARLTRRAFVDDSLIERLAGAIGWALVGYLYFRFWDAFAMTYTYQPGRSEALALLTRGQLAYNFWLAEIIGGAVIPLFVLLSPRWRRNRIVRTAALALIVAGVVAYRWDVTLAGQLIVSTYLPQEIQVLYTQYSPSMIELVTGAGVVAYGLLAFTFGVRFLNVVDHRPEPRYVREGLGHPAAAAAAVTSQ